MVQFTVFCAMCGEMFFDKDGRHELEATRDYDSPHYDLDADLKKAFKGTGWIFEDKTCGDSYCSRKCAKGEIK